MEIHRKRLFDRLLLSGEKEIHNICSISTRFRICINRDLTFWL